MLLRATSISSCWVALGAYDVDFGLIFYAVAPIAATGLGLVREEESEGFLLTAPLMGWVMSDTTRFIQYKQGSHAKCGSCYIADTTMPPRLLHLDGHCQ